MRIFKITGKVISSDAKEGIKGFRVEAWDKDLLFNDMLGSAITGEDGVFRIQFEESYFEELFLDRRPDIFFKIFKGTELVKSTEDSVLWNVDREDIEQTIEVKGVNQAPAPKNKAALIRQRGSEVFKFITLRPFQRQGEASIEKKRVLCYKPLNEEKSEFHRALLYAKEHPPEDCGPREAIQAEAVKFIETEGSTFVRGIHDLSNPQAPRSSQYTAYRSSPGLLEEWIFRGKKPIPYEDFLSEIKNAYGKDNINDIAHSPEFQTDIYRLQDSIMALAIVPSHPHSQRDRLVNALRICRIIDRIVEGDPDLMQPYGIDRAMRAPVVLPTDIFPLPPAMKIDIEAFHDRDTEREGAELFRLPRRKRIIRRGLSRMEFMRGPEAQPWQPEDLEPIRVPQSVGLVKPVGFGEYNTVRQTLLRYEAGEIAHIENVLRGEYKERVHRRLRRLEEEVTYEEERKTTMEKDLQSTDRFELKREASETIKEEHKADAGVTVKYDGPTVDVEAKAGYNYTHAREEAKKTSVSYARDVTEKSLSRLEEKVREVRIQKTIEEFEETNTHGIDNKEKTDHAVGIYRWVDKIYESQVIGYGERLFFDFVIPEPAAFYLYALTHGATTDLEEPVPPMVDENGEPCGEDNPNARPLRPDDINSDNYQGWLSYYQATGINPYPEIVKIFSKSWKAEEWKSQPEGNATKFELSEVLDLEDDYKAESAYVLLNFPKTSGMCLVQSNMVARVAIGRKIANLTNCVALVSYPDHNEYDYWFKAEIDSLDEEGSIPFSAVFVTEDQSHVYDPIDFKNIGPLTLEIKCVSSFDKRKSWQLETYDAIVQAYLREKAEYEEKSAVAAIQEGISISGRNPALNREIEETELKRWALSMITGQHFELFNAMQTDRQGYPGINFSEADAEGSYIQFFEQAFEWPLITYLFYPYFWGKRNATWEGGPTWIDKISGIQDVDPLFEKFLKAGAARVTVPVRPGFEDAVMNYISTAEIWSGGEKPTIDDPLYVSIVEEIQQQQGAYVEKSKGTISVGQGNVQVVGTATDFEENDVDREIYIEGKRYVIAEVQDVTHLTLAESYRGETKQYARYYIGARMVGGPWEVRVPTTLVYLQEDATLPDFTEEG